MHSKPSMKLVIDILFNPHPMTKGIKPSLRLAWWWPDEREQKTAFWSGLYLELPIGWGQIYYLVKNENTNGQSLEIWSVLRTPSTVWK